MKKQLWSVCVSLLVTGSAFAGSGDVQMVGVDEDGQSVEVSVPAPEFESRMSEVVMSTHDSAITVLKRESKGGSWLLRTVVVGLGVSLEAGLGPIIKVGAVPRFRLLFSNSKDPILP